MKIGLTVRNMGTQSTREILGDCVAEAEALGFESVWITDHIAIPPDDAEGSGGRYLDTLTTLAWLAGQTQHIQLGSGVLILPYRAVLPTAKQVATLQELSNGRLILGVGIGWMDSEFRALGVDRHQRARISDDILAFLNTAFANDEVNLNGQDFLFKPRPARPPILIGGRAPHALTRALQHGDGWLPMAKNAAQVKPDIETYFAAAQAQGRTASVSVMTGFADIETARQEMDAYKSMGVERVICAMRYANTAEFRSRVQALQPLLEQSG